MPLHLGIPKGHGHNMQEQTRDARRMLQQSVRDDWQYPSAPHQESGTYSMPNTNAKATVTAHVANCINSTPLAAILRGPDFEPVGWREREYSENETSEDEDEQLPSPIRQKKRVAPPAASDESIAERKLARKRRRQARFDEEMTWNIGLAHFSAQRNAWTAARTAIPQPETIENGQDLMDVDSAHGAAVSRHMQHSDTMQAMTEDATVRLPVPPKLLPDHPVRARITSSTYAEIYSKIILQARTPTIPINLQDIINALIYGWKEEGNWPPQSAPPEPSVVVKSKKKQQPKPNDDPNTSPKHPHLTKGVHVVTKVFHGLTGGPLDAHACISHHAYSPTALRDMANYYYRKFGAMHKLQQAMQSRFLADTDCERARESSKQTRAEIASLDLDASMLAAIERVRADPESFFHLANRCSPHDRQEALEGLQKEIDEDTIVGLLVKVGNLESELKEAADGRKALKARTEAMFADVQNSWNENMAKAKLAENKRLERRRLEADEKLQQELETCRKQEGQRWEGVVVKLQKDAIKALDDRTRESEQEAKRSMLEHESALRGEFEQSLKAMVEQGRCEERAKAEQEAKRSMLEHESKSTRERDSLRGTIQTRDADLQSLQTILQTKDEILQNQVRERDSLQSTIQTRDADLQSLQTIFQTKDEMLQTILQTKDEMLQNQVRERHSLQSTIQTRDADLQILQARITELDDTLVHSQASLETKDGKLHELEDQLKALGDDLAKSQEDASIQRQKFEMAYAAYHDFVRRLTVEYTRRDKENAEKRRERERANAAVPDDIAIASLQATLDSRDREVQRLQAQVKALGDDLAKSQEDASIQRQKFEMAYAAYHDFVRRLTVEHTRRDKENAEKRREREQANAAARQ